MSHHHTLQTRKFLKFSRKYSWCYRFVCTFWHYHLQSPKQLCSVIFSTEKYGALFCVFGVSVVGVSVLPLFPMVGCVIQNCILLQKLVNGGVLLFWRNFSFANMKVIVSFYFKLLQDCSSISETRPLFFYKCSSFILYKVEWHVKR